MHQQAENRSKAIIRCSAVGVGMNLILSATKIVSGSLVHSHAIIMDGINSLLDMGTSLISILFATLAGRRESRSHPFGFGRLEYLGSMLVTMVVLYFGTTTAVESVIAILHPHDPPSYNTLTVIIMLLSLIAKLIYGIMMKKRGKQLRSGALVMSAVDSLADALISVGILAAILVWWITGFDIEHYVCVIISLMILKTGIVMIRDSLTKMVGSRPDPALRKELLDMIALEDGVLNVAGIVLHNYGEGRDIGSVSIEVDEKLSTTEICRLSRRIVMKGKDLGVNLTSVGIRGTSVSDPEEAKVWDAIIGIAKTYHSIRRVNSFSMDRERREISFYVVPDYNLKMQLRNAELQRFEEEVCNTCPEMRVEILQDIDV